MNAEELARRSVERNEIEHHQNFDVLKAAYDRVLQENSALRAEAKHWKTIASSLQAIMDGRTRPIEEIIAELKQQATEEPHD